jgi:GNAT superfamily N-acetyltransferase
MLTEIHKVGPEAIPLIQQLTLEVWPQTYADLLTDEQIVYMLNLMYSEDALQQQMKNNCRFIIAACNHLPVGFASYGPTDQPYEYKLHKLYVIGNAQKTGAGKKMVGYIINEARQFNASHLILQVNRQNENAIGFYQHMGFHKEQEADFDIGNGFYMNDYVMGISL